jgi:deoxyribose-phosphate aldolase
MDRAQLVKVEEVTREQIATICDHTFLDTIEGYKYSAPDCDPIRQRELDFYAFMHVAVNGPLKFAGLCVRGTDTVNARKYLDSRKSPLILAVTTGFPDGRVPLNQKMHETSAALENGADEIDFVINWEKMMTGGKNYVQWELNEMAKLIRDAEKKSKAILETNMLDPEAIRYACDMAQDAGIDFVKTSTGYTKGATAAGVRMMRERFSRGVKASGGVKMTNVYEMLAALSGRTDGMIELNPDRIRIGEGSLFKKYDNY